MKRQGLAGMGLAGIGLLSGCGPAVIVAVAAAAGGGGGGGGGGAAGLAVTDVIVSVQAVDSGATLRIGEPKTTAQPQAGAGPTAVTPSTAIGLPQASAAFTIEGDATFSRVVLTVPGFSGFWRLDLSPQPAGIPLNLNFVLSTDVRNRVGKSTFTVQVFLANGGGPFGARRQTTVTIAEPNDAQPLCADTQGMVAAVLTWGIPTGNALAPLRPGGDLDLILDIPGFGPFRQFDTLCGRVPPPIEAILGGPADLPFEVVLVDPATDPGNFPSLPLGNYTATVRLFEDDVSCTEFPFSQGIDEVFFLLTICADGEELLSASGSLDLLDEFGFPLPPDPNFGNFIVESTEFNFQVGDSTLWFTEPIPFSMK